MTPIAIITPGSSVQQIESAKGARFVLTVPKGKGKQKIITEVHLEPEKRHYKGSLDCFRFERLRRCIEDVQHLEDMQAGRGVFDSVMQVTALGYSRPAVEAALGSVEDDPAGAVQLLLSGGAGDTSTNGDSV